ncbi:MAG TPA: 4Fe-4S binding protein [Atribacterota bacterium]|nr:4Fe-4S binding protein [Atribacterota bacterium]
MIKKKAILRFDSTTVEKPVTYYLIKKYDLWINILQARFEPSLGGKLVIELRGEKKQLDQAFAYLKEQNIKVDFLEEEISWDKLKCNHCGACVSICPVGALKMNRETYYLEFNYQDCVVCGYCTDACPVQAIEIIF